MTQESRNAADSIDLKAMQNAQIGDEGEATNVDWLFGEGFTKLFTMLFTELNRRIDAGFSHCETQFRNNVAEYMDDDMYGYLNYAYKEHYLILLTAAMNVLIAGETIEAKDHSMQLIKMVNVNEDPFAEGFFASIGTFESLMENTEIGCSFDEMAQMLNGNTVMDEGYYIGAYKRRKGTLSTTID